MEKKQKDKANLNPIFYVNIVNIVKLGSVIVERFINTGFAFSKLSKKAFFLII